MVTFTIVPNNGSGSGDLTAPGEVQLSLSAGVAQVVEHLICNQRVGGSNPFASSRKRISADGGLGSGATGFSNALHSDLFRRVVILARSCARFLVSLILRNPDCCESVAKI